MEKKNENPTPEEKRRAVVIKIVAGVALVALLIGGAVGACHNRKNSTSQPTAPTGTLPQGSDSTESTGTEEQPTTPSTPVQTPEAPTNPETPTVPQLGAGGETTGQPVDPQPGGGSNTNQPIVVPQPNPGTPNPGTGSKPGTGETVTIPPATDNTVIVPTRYAVTAPVGQTVQLDIFYFGSGTLRYYSSHPKCLTVSETGAVRSIYEGNYYVYITDGTYTAEVSIFAPAGFWANTGLSFETPRLTLEVGKSTLLKTNWDDSGNFYEIYSLDKDIATTYGSYVTAVKPGTAIIRATDGYDTAHMVVTVVEATGPGDTLMLTETRLSMYVGEGHQFRYVYTGDRVLSWESSDTNIARVDENGKVHTYGQGAVQIRVTDGVLAHACTINVSIKPGVLVEVLEIGHSDGMCYDRVTKYAGDYLTIRLNVDPYFATQDLFRRSSDWSVVSIEEVNHRDHIYKLHFLKEGTATVTFTSADDAKTLSYTFNVKSGYDFDPGDGILDPQTFADYVNKIMEANGVVIDQGVTGWLLGTYDPLLQGEMNFDLAVKWAYGFYHTWWWNISDTSPTEGIHLWLEYIGNNANGYPQFKEHR